MPAAPIPPDEEKRLRALRCLSILDTGPEQRFDRLTRLAAFTFETPFAMISLVDEDRQWFKSQQGLDAKETPRSVSFCGHGILLDEPMIVPDATLDPRFADSPVVTGKLGIRFYAGCQLHAPDGSHVGMFCIMDRRQRRLAQDEIEALQDLARIVEDELNDVKLNQAYAAMAEREAELEDFIENAGDLILRTDPEKRVLYANRAFREALGRTDAELKTMGIEGLLPASEHARCREQFARVLAGETVRDFETVLLASDGREIPVSGSVNLQIKDGRPFATRMILRDITARKTVERFRSEFFHQVNHELRNPLTLIVGGLRLLEDQRAGMPQEQIKWLDMIERNTSHLQRMIEDLLELTRSETGKLAVFPQAMDIAALASQIVSDFRPAAESKKIALKSRIPAGLPPALADPIRYRQILGNLIDNALKFTPEGGEVKVAVGRAEHDLLETSVADTGLGIPEKDIPKLFEHLSRASSNFELRRKGLGLGLYICKSLVSRQGGRIWVESQPGQGSTFHFTLPASVLAKEVINS